MDTGRTPIAALESIKNGCNAFEQLSAAGKRKRALTVTGKTVLWIPESRRPRASLMGRVAACCLEKFFFPIARLLAFVCPFPVLRVVEAESFLPLVGI